MGRRILAIFRKEAQDLVTNFNVSFIFVLPFGIVVLFQRMMSEMEAPPSRPLAFFFSGDGRDLRPVDAGRRGAGEADAGGLDALAGHAV